MKELEAQATIVVCVGGGSPVMRSPTGRRARIGSSDDAPELLDGFAGTTVTP